MPSTADAHVIDTTGRARIAKQCGNATYPAVCAECHARVARHMLVGVASVRE